MVIAREGLRIIIPEILITILMYPYKILFTLLLLLTIFTIFFFRDLKREIGDGIISPADGKIDFLSNNRVEIFMGLFDCHINISPCDGIVRRVERIEGNIIPAFKRGENVKKNVIEIEGDGIFKIEQIAGIFARRITCKVRKGDFVKKGDKIGMIVFGSRVTLEIPEGYRFIRKVGEKVKAGETLAIREC